MQKSKMIRDFDSSGGALIASLSSIFRRPASYIRNVCLSVKRSYDYAKFGWSNEDYDHNFLLKHIEFKLKRLQKVISNGHHVPDKSTDQSIRICIKLINKLSFKDYSYFTDIHYAKWGQPEVKFIKQNDSNYSVMEITHENAKTEQERNQQSIEFTEAYKKDDRQRQRDTKLLFNIMSKYIELWWD